MSNTIGEIGKGFQQQMAQFVVERMWAAYSAVGGCERAIERTAAYLRERAVCSVSRSSPSSTCSSSSPS